MRMNKKWRKEDGIVAILAALLLVPLILFILITTTVSDWLSLRSRIQKAADVAAADAASSFCSTRRCYNLALVNALDAIRRSGMRGKTSRDQFASEIQVIISDLEEQIDTAVLYGPSGKNEWDIDGLIVRIQRGRWWPYGLTLAVPSDPWEEPAEPIRLAPSNIDEDRLIPQEPIFNYSSTVTVEPKFEPFDRFDDTDWQTEAGNTGTPSFMAANAVRVILQVDDYSALFSFGMSPSTAAAAETIAARNKNQPMFHFCVAPFAIPVCALLNEQGEFHPDRQCNFDRYFTEEERYCGADRDCDVLPGSWYAPATVDGSCEEGDPWYSQQRCQCALSANDCQPGDNTTNPFIAGEEDCPADWVAGRGSSYNFSGPDNVKGVPCAQDFGQAAMHCSFFPWPYFNDVSDHYGVVGLPQFHADSEYADEDLQSEALYRRVLNGELFADRCIDVRYDGARPIQYQPTGTVSATIGQLFEIKEGGLTELVTDRVMWRRISNSGSRAQADDDAYPESFENPRFYDPYNAEYDPENGFRELGVPWFIGRVNDETGYPVGATRDFLDELIEADKIEPYNNYGEVDSEGEPLQAVEPWQCVRQGLRQYGACNSHRVWYDNRCHRKVTRWYFPVPTGDSEDGYNQCSDVSISPHPWQHPNYGNPAWNEVSGEAYCYEDLSRGGGVNFIDWRNGYPQGSSSYLTYDHRMDLTSDEEWNCETVPPYMPCPPSADNALNIDPARPVSYDNVRDLNPAGLRVWNTRVAVIADTSADAPFCKGVAGSTDPDPLIDPSREWRIIGFIRAYIFDNDIGKDPPAPPGEAWNELPDAYTPSRDLTFHQPRVCEYDSGSDSGNRKPWAFNPTYLGPPADDPTAEPQEDGSSRACNMVRARVACEPGLIAGDFEGLPTEIKAAPAIVYTRNY